ncbi:MAG TPA: HAMP domain-containing sensor histidine kinase [Patescibacteria group bacterium]|nr:HAMP domain-containing sensor histidine kinase [Patescibacteria group bacterium]
MPRNRAKIELPDKASRLEADFISLTSHQLRTPLTGVKWLLELLEQSKTDNLTRKQKDILEKIYLANERMIKLVNDLLEVSRLESGNTKLYLQPTDLAGTINQVLRQEASEIKKKEIRVTFTVEQEPFPFVDSEPIKIKQAVLNLVENAITYCREKSRIDINLMLDHGFAHVTFRDTGVGIPKAQQPRVFSKFFRGSNILEFESTGTGLGMYITKSFIEASGGRIWFESKQGKGTTFHFTLPVEKSA